MTSETTVGLRIQSSENNVIEEDGRPHIRGEDMDCDMACPQHNIETKRLEKLTKYRQLALEMRKRRLGYEIIVVPVTIGALGGGMRTMMGDISRIFEKDEVVKRTAAEMPSALRIDSKGMDDTPNF